MRWSRVEDRRFYEHLGVDPIGIVRSVGVRVKEGHWTQGGSTITQQLARNIFLTNNKTWTRKVREQILALALERKFSKDQILELYLNKVYFGGGSYGIDAAARKFFGHGADHLSLPEAAIIAGLVKAPSNYSPTADVQAARDRATVVLQTMVETGKISQGAGDRGRSRRRHARARAATEQRALLHRLGAAPARDADRRPDRSARRVDDARSGHAARGRSHDPGRHTGRPAGRAGVDGARRRGTRDGRRQGLYHVELQPCGDRAAPARIGVEAVRLSRRDRGGPQTRRSDRRRADHDRRLEPAQRRASLLRPDQHPHRLRAVAQHGRGEARADARLRHGRRHGAALRHLDRDQHASLDGARHLRRRADRHDPRLRRGRQQGRDGRALWDHQGGRPRQQAALPARRARESRAGGAVGGRRDDRPAADRGQHRHRPRSPDRAACRGQDRHDADQPATAGSLASPRG